MNPTFTCNPLSRACQVRTVPSPLRERTGAQLLAVGLLDAAPRAARRARSVPGRRSARDPRVAGAVSRAARHACSVRCPSGCRSTSRCASPSTRGSYTRTRSCSTARPRCRCPRSCSCRTTAPNRGRPSSRSTVTVRASRRCAASTATRARPRSSSTAATTRISLAERGLRRARARPALLRGTGRLDCRPTSTAATSTSCTRSPPAPTRSRRTCGTSPAASTCSSSIRWSTPIASGWSASRTAARRRCSSPRGTTGCAPRS